MKKKVRTGLMYSVQYIQCTRVQCIHCTHAPLLMLAHYVTHSHRLQSIRENKHEFVSYLLSRDDVILYDALLHAIKKKDVEMFLVVFNKQNELVMRDAKRTSIT